MSVQTTPHINFRGEAREALAYYQTIFGGEVMAASYNDIHAAENDRHGDEVAFGRITAPNGFDLMAYDVQPSKGYDPGTNPFYITLSGQDETEISTGWEQLAADAKHILIPLGPAPFAPLYGMLTDRFGVTWIIGVIGAA